MLTKIQKWGNSLAIRIPKSFANQTNLSNGSSVDLNIRKDSLIITPFNSDEYNLDAMIKRINNENLHEEISFEDAVGKELF